MSETVGNHPTLRKVIHWEWDPQSNTLVEKKQMTRRGATGLLSKVLARAIKVVFWTRTRR